MVDALTIRSRRSCWLGQGNQGIQRSSAVRQLFSPTVSIGPETASNGRHRSPIWFQSRVSLCWSGLRLLSRSKLLPIRTRMVSQSNSSRIQPVYVSDRIEVCSRTRYLSLGWPTVFYLIVCSDSFSCPCMKRVAGQDRTSTVRWARLNGSFPLFNRSGPLIIRTTKIPPLFKPIAVSSKRWFPSWAHVSSNVFSRIALLEWRMLNSPIGNWMSISAQVNADEIFMQTQLYVTAMPS